MKAMFAAFAAIVVIAIGAHEVLERSGFSSAEQSTSSSVRLGEQDGKTRFPK